MIKIALSIIVSIIVMNSAYSQDGVWITSYEFNCKSPERIHKTYNSGSVFVISGDSIFSVDINNSNGKHIEGLGGKFSRTDSVCKVSESMFGFPWEFVMKDERNFVVSRNGTCTNHTIVNTQDTKKINPKYVDSIFEKFYTLKTSIEAYNYDFDGDTISFKNTQFKQEYSYQNIDSRIFELEGKLFMAANFIRPSIYPIVELNKNHVILEPFGEQNELIELRIINISNPQIKVTEKKLFDIDNALIDH